MVPSKSKRTTWGLIGRSLEPSGISGSLCFCFGVLFVLVHLVLLSVSAGTSLPELFDGEWATMYTNTVVQPLDSLLHNLVFNNVLTIILWGFVGLGIYFLFEYTFHLIRNWRDAQRDVQLAGQSIVFHPMRQSFFATVIWRMGVLIVAAVFFLAITPIIEWLLKVGPQIVNGTVSLAAGAPKLGLAIVSWTLICHCVVVLFRLFVMRTRLFTDELY